MRPSRFAASGGGRKAEWIRHFNRRVIRKSIAIAGGPEPPRAAACNCAALVSPPLAPAIQLTVELIVCLSPTGVCSFLTRSCRGAPVSPDASCRRGTYFVTYGLPVVSSLKAACGLWSRYAARFLLAPRPFVQPTLPVRAVQAGLSIAERRGGRQSQARWLSATASIRRGWLRPD